MLALLEIWASVSLWRPHLWDREDTMPWLSLRRERRLCGMCLYHSHWVLSFQDTGESWVRNFFNWNDSGLHNQRLQIT